jgi:Fe(3+) dicitrate transport protein
MNNYYKVFSIVLLVLSSGYLFAQQKSIKDTLQLDSVIIKENRLKHLSNVTGTYIFAGKKTNLVYPDANAKYFTRRINMYPGPGILPADGRTFNIGFGLKL